MRGTRLRSEKRHIRKRLLEERERLGAAQVRQKGAAATRRLMENDLYRRAHCLSCYVSVKNEVHTHALIRSAIHAGKRVAAPVLTSRPGEMIHREVHGLEDLELTRFGLLQPPEKEGIPVSVDAFDLIVVPVVAFDRRGYRIGFGGGYYDRFLAAASAPSVGLAYDFQAVDRIPSEPNDVPLDKVFTETFTYRATD